MSRELKNHTLFRGRMSLAQVGQGKGRKQGIQKRSVPPEKEKERPESERGGWVHTWVLTSASMTWGT